MTKIDDTPLSITSAALQAASAHCMHNPDVESCGFIVGRGGVGSRVIGIRNVARQANVAFEMDHQGILAAMTEVDDHGEDIIAVYHSHPTSDAMPSELDKAVPDIDPVQLIISLKDGQPRCRAWRLDAPFVGERNATEVMVHISDDGQPFTMRPPVLPWALTPGNTVIIEYARIGHPGNRTITVKVVGTTGREEGAPGIKIESPRKTDPKTMDVSRIKAVTVLHESATARKMRQKMALLARRAAYLMNEQQPEDIPEIVAILAAAYPSTLIH